MKKAIQILLYLNASLVFISIFITLLFIVKFGIEQDKKIVQCIDSYKIMCVQLHACTNNPVAECDSKVEELKLCLDPSVLPPSDIMIRCTEQMRHIQCDQQLPLSCSVYMGN